MISQFSRRKDHNFVTFFIYIQEKENGFIEMQKNNTSTCRNYPDWKLVNKDKWQQLFLLFDLNAFAHKFRDFAKT